MTTRSLAAVLALGAGLALPALAEVSGVVTNQTTGRPQEGVTVTLYRLGAETGLESIESVTSTSGGLFSMNQTPQGPHLVQTAWDGVTYNHQLPPGRPSTGLTLDVWDASPRPPEGARIEQHIIVVEADATDLRIQEHFQWRNDSKLSFNNPEAGTLRFYVPPDVTGRIVATGTAPQGLPIERAPMETGASNIYSLDFPIKPGRTSFDVRYQVPYATPGRFSTRILPGDGQVFLVSALGVTLTGNSIVASRFEPSFQATVYSVEGDVLDLMVEGLGTLNGPVVGEGEGDQGIQQIRPRIYDRLYFVVALSGVILTLAFLLLYRRSA